MVRSSPYLDSYWHTILQVQAAKCASRKKLHQWISERTAIEFLIVRIGLASRRMPDQLSQIALFCADLLHSLGGILNYRWIAAGNVYTGPYCIFQGKLRCLPDMTSPGAQRFHRYSTTVWRSQCVDGHPRMCFYIFGKALRRADRTRRSWPFIHMLFFEAIG